MLQIVSDHIMIPSAYYVVHSTDEMCVVYHAGVFYITHIELVYVWKELVYLYMGGKLWKLGINYTALKILEKIFGSRFLELGVGVLYLENIYCV